VYPVSITITGTIAKRIVEESRKHGVTLEEYLIEILSQALAQRIGLENM